MRFEVTTTFEDFGPCCECGIIWAAPAHFIKERRNDHKWFYCPNGHRQHYPQESEEERLRRERDRLRQEQAYLEGRVAEEERRAATYKGHATRLRRRAKAGVCPCCNRNFQNLARHMDSKHPRLWKRGPARKDSLNPRAR